MTLVYSKNKYRIGILSAVTDYFGEIKPFVRRVSKKHLLIPLVILKSIEWSIYRWHKTPIRRFYSIKGNELIYMITRHCNERCTKCGIWMNPEPMLEHLDIKDFINCLNILHQNLYQVTLTGGEPLLFLNDVLTIAEESRKLNVLMIVVTNGTLITKEFLEKYQKLDHILVISLDTLDKAKWHDFRGNSDYEHVINNILLAHKYLGKKLRIQSVLAEESKIDIDVIKEFCRKLKIQHVIQPYMDFGGSWHNDESNPVEMKEVVCDARKNICIYPNGDVIKCFDHHRIPIAKKPLGNIVNEDIIQILSKRRATEISRLMKTCDFPCKYLSCNLPKSTN